MNKFHYLWFGVFAILMVALVFFAPTLLSASRALTEQMTQGIGQKNPGVMSELSQKLPDATAQVPLPPLWPKDVPVIEGASIQASKTGTTTDGNPGMMAVYMTDKTSTDLEAFYTNVLQNGEWQPTAHQQKGTQLLIGATRPQQKIGIVISNAGTEARSVSLTIERLK